MKRFFTIFIVVTFLTNCGGGSSKEAKELLSQILTIVGIPQDIIVNICQDSDGDGLCSIFELNGVEKMRSINKITLESGNIYRLKNYDPTKKIIMELQDRGNIELNDGNFSLEYKGTTTTLSILTSMVDSNFLDKNRITDVDRLEDSDTFYSVLLHGFERNLNLYMKNSLPQRDARDINLKELGRVFSEDIPLDRLRERIKRECDSNRSCIKDALESLSVNLLTDEQNIYILAQERRGVKKLLNDKLIEEFSCIKRDRKVIKHFGFEDIFSLKNGVEYARASLPVVKLLGKENLVNYDSTKRGIFAESVRDLPRKIRGGRFFIGLQRRDGKLDSRDTIYIGRYSLDDNRTFFSSKLRDLEKRGWLHKVVSTTSNPTTDIYYIDFKDIIFNDSKTTLLEFLDKKTKFDVVVKENTAVDFISVAVCAMSNPKLEIKNALSSFECESGDLVSIAGGAIDAFSLDIEDNATTPSEHLLSIVKGDIIGYDEESGNKTFIDSLDFLRGRDIKDAQFSIGIKPESNYLYQNDIIVIGSAEFNRFKSFKLYGVDEGSVYSLWDRTIQISNGERVLQVDFNDINISDGISFLDFFNRREALFDILVKNDTRVDFSYLNLCIE